MVSNQVSDVQKAWLKKYCITAGVTALVAALALDGGVLLLSYVLTTTPIAIVSFLVTKMERIARIGLLAIVVPLLTLGLSAAVVELLSGR